MKPMGFGKGREEQAMFALVTRAILCVWGISLAVAGLAPGRSRWSGKALLMAGAAAAVAGALGFAARLGKDHFDGRTVLAMERLMLPLLGFTGGVLVTVLVAGELGVMRLRRKRD